MFISINMDYNLISKIIKYVGSNSSSLYSHPYIQLYQALKEAKLPKTYHCNGSSRYCLSPTLFLVYNHR